MTAHRSLATVSRVTIVLVTVGLIAGTSAQLRAQQLPGSCSFSDDPLTPGATVVRAAHINELRACINDLRTQRALTAIAWTDGTLTPGQSVIQVVDIVELRNALIAAFQTVPGLQLPTFSHTLVARSSMVTAVDIAEIRIAVLNLATQANPANSPPPDLPAPPPPEAPAPPEVPPQAPPGSAITLLVNGSFTPTPQDAEWANPGSDEFQTIAATYGTSPQQFFWSENSLSEVLWPYVGIVAGSHDLANLINMLPAGDVNVIAHSHGGNVAILATYWGHRQIRHLIELGTPVNADVPPFGPLERLLGGAAAYSRCQVSSLTDLTQVAGASPRQTIAWGQAVVAAATLAADAIILAEEGDDEGAWSSLAEAGIAALQAQQLFQGMKVEWGGLTIMFGSGSHASLHEPAVWNSIWRRCAVN
jgi:hypothetical protein